MKKNKEEKFQFKELFTNKQYRSIMILAFYAVLFTILIVAIRNPGKSSVSESGGSVTNLKGYELIDNKNFGYKYTVILDDDTYVYEGEKFKDKELVTLSKDGEKREYYFNGENIYVNNNGKYIETIEKPIFIFDFFNTDILDQLIIRGVIVDEEVHRYKIDNQDLYDVLNEDNTKVESGENYITLSYRNKTITRIVLEITNYSKLVGENYNKVIISLEYFDFNLIENFDDITVE